MKAGVHGLNSGAPCGACICSFMTVSGISRRAAQLTCRGTSLLLLFRTPIRQAMSGGEPAGPPRLRLFIAQRPPDNKQRLNQQDQVRNFLDQLLDTGLVLDRPDLATLSGGSARSATRMYSSMDEILRIDSYSSGANLERCTSEVTPSRLTTGIGACIRS